MGGWISLGARGDGGHHEEPRQTIVAPNSTKGDTLRSAGQPQAEEHDADRR